MSEGEIMRLGKRSEEEWDRLIREASLISETGSRIAALSGAFLGVPYEEFTLAGAADREEVYVINLAGVDCFTFIDYVEAMQISGSFDEFKKNVQRVRYMGSRLSFQWRNHFFTDWIEANRDLVTDITGDLGQANARRAIKMLNCKDDGTFYLEGLAPKERQICYIPTELMNQAIVSELRTGDLVGIYTPVSGLDVSHVGLAIRRNGVLYFRHASSAPELRKVVDQDFCSYIMSRPGIVVLRPIN